jgi:hypothetical protein
MDSNSSMKHPLVLLATLTIATTLPAHSDLPMMEQRPWLGYFLGYRDKGASFGISSEGNTLFEPLKRDATPNAVTNPIHVKFDIIETLPDGKTVRKKIDDDAFTSDSPASLDPKEAITIRGKVTGSSSLKNPLQLPICMDFLPHKYSVSTDSKEQLKAFQKKPSAMRSISNSATVTTSISSSSTR